jgi:hypothetical protein
VELIHFPYDPDSQSQHLAATASPSETQWRDANIAWDETDSTWDEAQGSEHLEAIRQLVGTQNRRDVLHVDSAFKSGCKAFVTVDQDILSKREQLEVLLGIRFFHPERNEAELYRFIAGKETA